MATGPARESEVAKLQQRIGHTFRNPALLQQGLTHSSLAYEQAGEGAPKPDAEDNEQLEFLGDAVIGLIAADSLYRRYPNLKEGELTRLRAALVSRQHLAHVALKLQLGESLLLGKGEERSGGRNKAALLANCIEAVIAAIYLDAAPIDPSTDHSRAAGLDAARVFVEQWVVEPYVAELHAAVEGGSSIGDHKSALQEFLQARKAGQPQYIVKAETGPDHRKRFLVEVRILKATAASTPETAFKVLGRGSGNSKKIAEQEAAKRAYQKLLRGSQQLEAKETGAPELVV